MQNNKYKKRIEKSKAVLELKNLDAVLLTSLNTPSSNIYYFTGYVPQEPTFLLITKNRELLLTSEKEKVEHKCKVKEIIDLQEFKVSDMLKKLSLEKGKIGIDGKTSYNMYLKLQIKLPEVTFVDVDQDIEKIRAIKEPEEIEKIRKSCLITDRILSEIINEGLKNKNEEQIASEIRKKIVNVNKRWSFEPIVAGDINSSYIHHYSGNKKFKNTVLIDLGVKNGFYCSDMCRTFMLKKNKKIQKVLETLTELHSQLDEYITIGKTVSDVESFSQKMLTEAGYETTHYGNFHALGHGVGLEVHESPAFSKKSAMKLTENMVFTLEPAIYIKENFGVRIEDVVVLTKKGIKRLTKFPMSVS